MEDSTFSPLVRFGIYEADVAAGELRKNGLKVKLQGKPFEMTAQPTLPNSSDPLLAAGISASF